MICVQCNKDQPRTRLERKGRGRAPFIDDTGRQWKGLQCPSCRYYVAKQFRTGYARKCRLCAAALPSNRFFNCTTCQPVLPADTIMYVVEYS